MKEKALELAQQLRTMREAQKQYFASMKNLPAERRSLMNASMIEEKKADETLNNSVFWLSEASRNLQIITKSIINPALTLRAAQKHYFALKRQGQEADPEPVKKLEKEMDNYLRNFFIAINRI